MSVDVKHRCDGHADPTPRRVEPAFSFMGRPGNIRAAVAFFLVSVSFGVQAMRLPTQRRRTLGNAERAQAAAHRLLSSDESGVATGEVPPREDGSE
jgi:hypothetical protein